MNEGYIKLNRKLLDWRYGNNMPMMGFWIYLLLKANWKDQERSHGVVRRGEFTSSVRQIACECGLSESTVKRYLNSLRKTGEIRTSTNRQWTKITILKYCTYQDDEPTAEPTIEPTIEPTAEPHLKKERKKEGKNTKEKIIKEKFLKPSLSEIEGYISEHGYTVDAGRFFNYYESNGWMVGKNHMKDWKAAVRTWQSKEPKQTSKEIDWRTILGE